MIALASGTLLLSDLGQRTGSTRRVPHVALLQHASQPLLDDGMAGILNGLASAGFINGNSGIPDINLGSGLGVNRCNCPLDQDENQLQFVSNTSKFHGNHTFKFGFTFKRDDTTDQDPGINSQFALVNEFGPVSSANPDPTTQPLDPGDLFGSGSLLDAEQAFPQRLSAPIAQYSYGLYAQDQWKISPSFQVTAGLRLEHNSNPVCQTNCFGRFASNYTNVTADDTTAYNSVIADLASPGGFAPFKHDLTLNPAFKVTVERQSDYYARGTKTYSDFFHAVAYILGGLMAIGAVFGTINTLYSAVSARAREIATLRALGFGAVAVVTSVILEALFLSLTGAILGAAAAWLLFDGHQKVLGSQVFSLTVNLSLAGIGVFWACAAGHASRIGIAKKRANFAIPVELPTKDIR